MSLRYLELLSSLSMKANNVVWDEPKPLTFRSSICLMRRTTFRALFPASIISTVMRLSLYALLSMLYSIDYGWAGTTWSCYESIRRSFWWLELSLLSMPISFCYLIYLFCLVAFLSLVFSIWKSIVLLYSQSLKINKSYSLPEELIGYSQTHA